MSKKTRVLYGYLRSSGKLVVRFDLVEEALKFNMMVRDYEEEFIKVNPQLDVKVKVEMYG